MSSSNLELYAVQNHEGQWFRAKGYGGSGNSWVDDIATARIYGKIGPARACVTYWSGYSDYPTPKIVKLIIGRTEVIDEEKRVAAAKKKKKAARLASEARHHELEIERLKKLQGETRRKISELEGLLFLFFQSLNF